MPHEVDRALARRVRDGDVLALARALVSVPSVNPALEAGGVGEADAAHLCAEWLGGWGFHVTIDEPRRGRPSVVGRLGRGGPSLILSGHLDTVGVEGMRISPFDPVIRDGRLYGRGSADMKGGVAAILAAAERRASRAGEPAGELIVVLSADEEFESLGLRALLDGGLRADYAVVAEPTGLAIAPANKGFLWVEADFHGRAAHGSRPEIGRDAIRAAGRFLAALDRYEAADRSRPPHPLLGRGSIHAGTIAGGTTPSVYPAHCRLVLEARMLPGETAEDVGQRLQEVADEVRPMDPEVRIELRTGLGRPAAALPEEHPLVRALAGALEAEGIQPRVEPMTAWVESAWFLEAGIPALCFGPGTIEKAHTDDESAAVAEIERAANVLERLVADLLAVPPGAGDGPDAIPIEEGPRGTPR